MTHAWLPMKGNPPRRPKALWLTFAFLLLAACGPSEDQFPTNREAPSPAAEQERLPPPGEAWVIFGTDTVQAEVARTPEQRERGLMFRERLDPGQGMFFVFPDSQTRAFWMKNTFIPLDIAYMDEHLRIVDIQAMEPEDESTYPSARPAMFALEVPRGWFEEAGIQVGAEARVVFGPGRP